MWYLVSESDPRVMFCPIPSGEIIIGRKTDEQTCNFPIQDDPSISRKHASVTVSFHELFIQDLSSRYGTFVNDVRLDGNVKVVANCGDTVRFGKMGCVWKVNKISFITCTSTLKGENLQNLKQCLTKLGGTLKNDWDESCAFLTMPAITLTIKVVLALVQGANIVDVNFWMKCVESVNANLPLPDPNNYTPHIIETTLNKDTVSFLPKEARKKLFKDKKIIFFSKRQLDMYKPVIEKSSGQAILLNEGNLTKTMLCEPEIIVIQYNMNISQESESLRIQVSDIMNYLSVKGKRVVADAEIGLAILYCSLERYCNPDFSFSEIVKPPSEPFKKPSNVLAPESQESIKSNNKDNIVIDETLVSNDVSSSKRKFDEEDNEIQGNASKKSATSSTVTETGKRKHCDDGNLQESVPKKLAINDDKDMFNFETPKGTNTVQNTEKKLCLTKPTKRTFEQRDNEDDLFNFVEDKSKSEVNDNTSNSIFSSKQNSVKQEVSVNDNKNLNSVDVSALRGIKLKELEENNLKMNSETHMHKKIKKEISEELGEKMNNLDLGATIITIKSDLVVKKEPIVVETHGNGQVRNFKKFKKVWPIKMQVTVIPTSRTFDSTSSNQSLSENSVSFTQYA